MAKIRMDKLPSMTQFLKENPNITPETYKRYQAAMKLSDKAGREVAKGLGGITSQSMKAVDIRTKDLSRIPYADEYLNKLAISRENMAQNAYQVYTERQDNYLLSLYKMMLEDSSVSESPEVEELGDWLTRATDEEKAGFIKEIKGRGAYTLYNKDTGEPEIDFGTVVSGIHTYIMGERSWLRSSRSRSYVDSIRQIMIANRQLNT